LAVAVVVSIVHTNWDTPVSLEADKSGGYTDKLYVDNLFLYRYTAIGPVVPHRSVGFVAEMAAVDRLAVAVHLVVGRLVVEAVELDIDHMFSGIPESLAEGTERYYTDSQWLGS
jgi:hypothetical protein